VLQCVLRVIFSVLQCVAAYSALPLHTCARITSQGCVAACCNMLQCVVMCNIPRVAVCCSVLQCVAVYCSLPSIATPYMCALLTSYHRGALQCVATCSACCNMLWFVAECDMPRVAACCSVLQPTQHCHSTHVLESNHTHEECI